MREGSGAEALTSSDGHRGALAIRRRSKRPQLGLWRASPTRWRSPSRGVGVTGEVEALDVAAQLVGSDVGVALRRVEVLVSEQLLDPAQVAPARSSSEANTCRSV